MKSVLSNIEIQTIQHELAAIKARAELIDDNGLLDTDLLDFDADRLEALIEVLENNYRLARINESGLRLI